jgi:hypothetical protein
VIDGVNDLIQELKDIDDNIAGQARRRPAPCRAPPARRVVAPACSERGGMAPRAAPLKPQLPTCPPTHHAPTPSTHLPAHTSRPHLRPPTYPPLTPNPQPPTCPPLDPPPAHPPPQQAVEHIHANEVILVLGYSRTVLHLLRRAAEKRSFEASLPRRKPAMLAGAALRCAGWPPHAHAHTRAAAGPHPLPHTAQHLHMRVASTSTHHAHPSARCPPHRWWWRRRRPPTRGGAWRRSWRRGASTPRSSPTARCLP